MKGLIIGNPVTDWSVDGKPSYLKTAYHYGIYGNDMQNKIENKNCTFAFLNVNSTLSKECQAIYEEFKKLTACINVYDVYRKPK